MKVCSAAAANTAAATRAGAGTASRDRCDNCATPSSICRAQDATVQCASWMSAARLATRSMQRAGFRVPQVLLLPLRAAGQRLLSTFALRKEFWLVATR